jgi:hypothetical protein
VVKLATPLQAACRNLRGSKLRVRPSVLTRPFFIFSINSLFLSPFKGQVHEQGALIRCHAVHWVQGM